MSKTTVKVTGLKELELSLAQFSKATGKAVLRRTLVKAAAPIRATAKAYAPFLEGDLEKSIKVTTKAPRGHDAGKTAFYDVMRGGGSKGEAVGAMRSARAANPNDATAEAFVVAKDRIAYAVEFGTGERVQKSTGKSVGKMTPDPFMRPAFDTKAPVAAGIIKETLRAEIAATASRIRAKAAGGAKR